MCSCNIAVKTATAIGRPKTSPVWDYFCYNEDEDDSNCQIEKSNRGMCGAKVKGKNPTSLKK